VVRQLAKFREQRGGDTEFTIQEPLDVASLWGEQSTLASFYNEELLTGNLVGAENLIRYQVLYRFGGIVIRPDCLPGIDREWWQPLDLDGLPNELVKSAIAQAVMESHPDDFPHRLEKINKLYRSGYVDSLGLLDAIKPGSSQSLLAAAGNATSLFQSIDPVNVIPGTVLVAHDLGRISDTVMAAAPQAEVVASALVLIERRYRFLESAGVFDHVFDMSQAGDRMYQLLDHARDLGFSLSMAAAVYHRMANLGGGANFNRILNGPEVIRDAISRVIQEYDDEQDRAPENHLLGQQVAHWLTLATEEHVALELETYGEGWLLSTETRKDKGPQSVLPLGESEDILATSEYLHNRHAGASKLYAPLSRWFEEAPDAFEEVVASQIVLVGNFSQSGSFAQGTLEQLVQWLTRLGRKVEDLKIEIHCLTDSAVSDSRLGGFFRDVVDALENRRVALKGLKGHRGVSQLDALGRTWVATVSAAGHFTWQQGEARRWIFAPQISGWELEQIESIEPGILKRTVRNDYAQLVDNVADGYFDTLRAQGYTTKDGVWFQKRWKLEKFGIQLVLDCPALEAASLAYDYFS
ncbi:MAG: TcdA/TcdB catalytic glycosyltransferase domain-containing protein, partial [Endozoicomonas sp.]